MTNGNILVLGDQGQLATALKQIEIIAGHPILAVGRPTLDFSRPETIEKVIADHNPVLVINAAAYTAVDKAESETELATAINATAVGVLGRSCADKGIPVIHISTDYVFDGQSNTPYTPDSAIAPQGIYGCTKAQGEAELRAANDQHLIFRTAWVYGEHGNNFLKTMIRLGETHPQIRVVDDQRGTPTYAPDMADGLAKIAEKILRSPQDVSWGTYHLTNSGETTWCGFAREIFDLRAKFNHPSPEIIPITTKEYPTPAARPAYSILDCSDTQTNFGVTLPDWKEATLRCIQKLEGEK